MHLLPLMTGKTKLVDKKDHTHQPVLPKENKLNPIEHYFFIESSIIPKDMVSTLNEFAKSPFVHKCCLLIQIVEILAPNKVNTLIEHFAKSCQVEFKKIFFFKKNLYSDVENFFKVFFEQNTILNETKFMQLGDFKFEPLDHNFRELNQNALVSALTAPFFQYKLSQLHASPISVLLDPAVAKNEKVISDFFVQVQNEIGIFPTENALLSSWKELKNGDSVSLEESKNYLNFIESIFRTTRNMKIFILTAVPMFFHREIIFYGLKEYLIYVSDRTFKQKVALLYKTISSILESTKKYKVEVDNEFFSKAGYLSHVQSQLIAYQGQIEAIQIGLYEPLKKFIIETYERSLDKDGTLESKNFASEFTYYLAKEFSSKMMEEQKQFISQFIDKVGNPILYCVIVLAALVFCSFVYAIGNYLFITRPLSDKIQNSQRGAKFKTLFRNPDKAIEDIYEYFSKSVSIYTACLTHSSKENELSHPKNVLYLNPLSSVKMRSKPSKRKNDESLSMADALVVAPNPEDTIPTRRPLFLRVDTNEVIYSDDENISYIDNRHGGSFYAYIDRIALSQWENNAIFKKLLAEFNKEKAVNGKRNTNGHKSFKKPYPVIQGKLYTDEIKVSKENGRLYGNFLKINDEVGFILFIDCFEPDAH